MRDVPPGWSTDLAILKLTGSTIEDFGDHLVVRSPHNPDFHWGNCLFVTDDQAVEQAVLWVERFRSCFPDANWIAIGLIRMPEEQQAWVAQGMELDLDDVLTTRALPGQTPVPEGYTVRRLHGDDWAKCIARAVAENDRSGQYDPQSHQRFTERQMLTRRELSERDTAAFFGAFANDQLIADLGVIRCGKTARYQSVGTTKEHRGRGLATHLLGVAAQWSAGHGCDRWVIVTEATNPAGRIYRGVGFEPDTANAQAYRKPPR